MLKFPYIAVAFLVLPMTALADCADVYLKMPCGGKNEIGCKQKSSEWNSCMAAENAESAARRKRKNEERLLKRQSEMDAVKKIDEANQKLNPHLDRSAGSAERNSAKPRRDDKTKSGTSF